MRILVDQDVYAATLRALRDAGHDVVRAAELGLARASDAEILAAATREDRALLTRDLDFGRLMQTGAARSAPVLLLRIRPETVEAVHQELLQVLRVHARDELRGCIVVVEPHRHRLRRPLG